MQLGVPPLIAELNVRLRDDRGLGIRATAALNSSASFNAATVASPHLRVIFISAVLQAQTDAGARPGPSSEELAETKRLKKENADLREANEILKAASIFFARELDPRHR